MSKRDTHSIIPVEEPMPGSEEKDLYRRMKSLEDELEFLSIREDYIKDEQKNLKREYIRAKEEVKRIQSVPLAIGQFFEMINENYAIISSTSGSNYMVRVLSTLNRELLKPSSTVALHKHSHAIVEILPPETDSTIQMMKMTERPDVTYAVSFARIFLGYWWS
jgi:26S proteasome regulatory subunit T3